MTRWPPGRFVYHRLARAGPGLALGPSRAARDRRTASQAAKQVAEWIKTACKALDDKEKRDLPHKREFPLAPEDLEEEHLRAGSDGEPLAIPDDTAIALVRKGTGVRRNSKAFASRPDAPSIALAIASPTSGGSSSGGSSMQQMMAGCMQTMMNQMMNAMMQNMLPGSAGGAPKRDADEVPGLQLNPPQPKRQALALEDRDRRAFETQEIR